MHEDVIAYYDQSYTDYQIIWGLKKYHAMHYGYYDTQHTSHGAALINMNRVIADRLQLSSSDVVLDAGCGVGGTAIWIAKEYGCRVVGISIVPQHIREARLLAERHGVAHLVTFEVRDYLATGCADSSFDAMYGIESMCYANDKSAFIAEAYRLLKAGGRLVVADGYASRDPRSREESYVQSAWLSGWAVPHLATGAACVRAAESCGFVDAVVHDVTPHIMSSSWGMHLATLITYPGAWMLYAFGVRTRVQMGNMRAAFYQYIALKKGLWIYGILYARKPQ